MFQSIFRTLGSQRNFTRRGAPYTVKDDCAVSLSEGKLSKKGVAGHSTHEVYMSYTDVFFPTSLLESPCKILLCLHFAETSLGSEIIFRLLKYLW